MIPDETPRATLAEDERAVTEVLAAHEFTVHEPAKPILDEQPFRMTEAIWGCVCGWRETNEALTEEEIPGDHFRAHVAEHLAPLLAAARAAGVAQGRPTRVDPVHCVNAAFGRCDSVKHKGDDCSLMYDERHPCTACHVERARAQERERIVAAIKAERDGFLDSPGLDQAWIAGWHSATDHHAARIAEGAEQ